MIQCGRGLPLVGGDKRRDGFPVLVGNLKEEKKTVQLKLIAKSFPFILWVNCYVLIPDKK